MASLDRSERFHRVCAETIVAPGPPLVTTEAVIVESCYLLRDISGAAEAVLGNVAEGNFRIPVTLLAVGAAGCTDHAEVRRSSN